MIAWLKRLRRFEIHKCTCGSTRPVYIYDANGWKRWCVDCAGRRP